MSYIILYQFINQSTIKKKIHKPSFLLIIITNEKQVDETAATINSNNSIITVKLHIYIIF